MDHVSIYAISFTRVCLGSVCRIETILFSLSGIYFLYTVEFLLWDQMLILSVHLFEHNMCIEF